MNIEIQANSSSLMNVYVYDIETFVLEPTGVFQFTNLIDMTNGTLKMHQTTSPLGIYFAEIKVYQLSLSINYGIDYRFYNVIGDYPSEFVNYIRITEGNLVLNANNDTVTSFAITDSIDFPFQM